MKLKSKWVNVRDNHTPKKKESIKEIKKIHELQKNEM